MSVSEPRRSLKEEKRKIGAKYTIDNLTFWPTLSGHACRRRFNVERRAISLRQRSVTMCTGVARGSWE